MGGSGHTQAAISQGPWRNRRNTNGLWMVTDQQGLPVYYVGGRTLEEGEANASLAAEAPNLLEICRTLIALADRGESFLPEDVALVRTVVAKAEGVSRPNPDDK